MRLKYDIILLKFLLLKVGTYMRYIRPNLIFYKIAQFVAWFVAKLVFRRQILRNELKGKKGPFVVIANHQAALDFVNLIGSVNRPMSFVISNSFYNTLPIKWYLKHMGLIPKQQFQTTAKDLKVMKSVIDAGEGLVIYPAGLMCEDGLSTPIPTATYKFLKWMNADVYVARSTGTYFVMPKWGKGMRAGRTYLDVFRLFSKEEIANLNEDQIKEKTDAALLFDAYREQEQKQISYKKGDNIEGLENVLYRCPHCNTEFSIRTTERNVIYCDSCGFRQRSNKMGFLHHDGSVGEEIRYVSDWSRYIYNQLKDDILKGEQTVLSSPVSIKTIDYKACKFKPAGTGTLTLSANGIYLKGELCGKPIDRTISISNIPCLPFSPGKYLEIQDGKEIYRCLPEDGKLVMKFINMIKIFYEIEHTAAQTESQEATV